MMQEFTRQSGILGMTTTNPRRFRRQMEAIVNGSFHNATFSQRLWSQQDALKGELDRLLTRALIQGLNPRTVAPELKKKFDSSEQAADLLMITELCRVQTEAQKLAFQEFSYEDYTFICNGGACKECEALNGKHFKVKDMQAGRNAPPMHPRCRCSTAAYMDKETFEKWLERAERGENVRWRDIDKQSEESFRAKTIKTEKELRMLSKSPVISMDSLDDIVIYFDGKYGIEIQDFRGLDLFKVKETLSGYDDFFMMFPEAGKMTQNIMFDPNFEDCGKMSGNGFSVVGPCGLAYGTGLHEAAHALDYAKSSPELHTFSNAVLMQAIREAGIKVYKSNIRKIIGSLFLNEDKVIEILSDPSELFAYSLETALGGIRNEFADVLLNVARRYYEEFV